jgi:hypothetical protein
LRLNVAALLRAARQGHSQHDHAGENCTLEHPSPCAQSVRSSAYNVPNEDSTLSLNDDPAR